MARTKQTARKSTGGRAPKKMLSASNPQQLRQFLTSRQMASYAGSGSSNPSSSKAKPAATSYLNYENMFYSYNFNTGPLSKKNFEPRFTSGSGPNPSTSRQENWVGMSFNSKYDGAGMKTHKRPALNLVIVLDVSGSMGWAFDQESAYGSGSSKLDVAKDCLHALTDQLKGNDKFGLVRFNHVATLHHPMKEWKAVNKAQLKRDIASLKPTGATCLTTAIDTATAVFKASGESPGSSSRVIFLTDLCSTVDSVSDERRLLAAIQANADRNIFTTVVGIGMDLNVALVEQISKTRGAKYCSVDSSEEFRRLMNQEFEYDVTILAFNIRIELKTPNLHFTKGYGSPELNNLKPGKPVVISSEFPSWQNEQGESKGGMFLFKLEAKKGNKFPKEAKICVTYEDHSGVDHTETVQLKLSDSFKDSGTRKAALLVHYIDLHNDYVHDRRQHGKKFLELFQSFRDHFTSELEEMKDKTLASCNKGDLELLDKIIELEQQAPGYVGSGVASHGAGGGGGGGTSTTSAPLGTWLPSLFSSSASSPPSFSILPASSIQGNIFGSPSVHVGTSAPSAGMVTGRSTKGRGRGRGGGGGRGRGGTRGGGGLFSSPVSVPAPVPITPGVRGVAAGRGRKRGPPAPAPATPPPAKRVTRSSSNSKQTPVLPTVPSASSPFPSFPSSKPKKSKASASAASSGKLRQRKKAKK